MNKINSLCGNDLQKKIIIDENKSSWKEEKISKKGCLKENELKMKE